MLRRVSALHHRYRRRGVIDLQALKVVSTTSVNGSLYAGNKILGIVREDFSLWERRSPLCPKDVQDLVKKGFKVIVQPCKRRIFIDKEFEEAGATISDDLSPACLILGVKKLPPERILNEKTYMFFSHVIKAQACNMPTLDEIISSKSRLFDYECITEGGRDSAPRLVAFGRYAGIAGMIDGLQGLGQRLLASGFSTPFLNVPNAFMFQNLDQARYIIRSIGGQIEQLGLPSHLSPLVVCFTGTGNVSKGAREIFELLPHEYITAEELPSLAEEVKNGKRKANRLYGLVAKLSDMVRRQGSLSDIIDKSHYYSSPEQYDPVFHERVIPYTTMLVNCIYWDVRFPRLLTKQQIKKIRGAGNKSLLVVADISCDVGGSVEFLSHATAIDKPFYSHVPETDSDSTEMRADGILLLGVDILPSELPRDASEHFGKALMPLIPPLLDSKGIQKTSSFSATDASACVCPPKELVEDSLPPELIRALIASNGQLMPKWGYIARLREQRQIASSIPSITAANNSSESIPNPPLHLSLNIIGHLFDSGLINRVLDYLEAKTSESSVSFTVVNCDVRPNTSSGPIPSRVQISIGYPIDHSCLDGDREKTNEVFQLIATELSEMVNNHPAAEGKIEIGGAWNPLKPRTDHSSPADASRARVDEDGLLRMRAPKRVLLFGAGRVAAPVIRLLSSHKNVFITVASDDESQARALIRDSISLPVNHRDVTSDVSERTAVTRFRWPEDYGKLAGLIKNCDVAISLLPATMHMPIAEECVKLKRPLVTASYVSTEMRKLHDRAVDAGVVLLNEVGLDPGIDHALIMSAVDSIHERGGTVTELISLCGGLPDPVAADNPFRYKFSWSPKGVISAAGNSARYLKDGNEVVVDGERLLLAAEPSSRFPTMRLEAIPNRDSLAYRDMYGVPKVKTICRGTLRYEGWSNVMHSLKSLGLFSTDPILPATQSWRQLIHDRSTGSCGGEGETIENILRRKGVRDIGAAIAALDWLGVTSSADSNFSNTSTTVTPSDAVCSLLEERLRFHEGERDMVAMYHSVTGELPGGKIEQHTSRMLIFGDAVSSSKDSAMAATVGHTTAAAAELILGLNKTSYTRAFGLKGVLTPTTPEIYRPLLSRLKEVGITWSEDIKVIDETGKI